MCRLLGYVSNEPTSIENFSGSHFKDFVKLSTVHKDSWGLSVVDEERKSTYKSVESAANSDRFQELARQERAKGALLHFRWASPGISVNEENAHPFAYEDMAFIHNGALQPYDALLDVISPFGRHTERLAD